VVTAAPADSDIAQVLAHFPEAVQATLLPTLLQQQQDQHQSGAGTTAEGAGGHDGALLVQPLLSALGTLPADKASEVISQLQPWLPQAVLQQLQQHTQ
jgi:predicted glycosyltransferase